MAIQGYPYSMLPIEIQYYPYRFRIINGDSKLPMRFKVISTSPDKFKFRLDTRWEDLFVIVDSCESDCECSLGVVLNTSGFTIFSVIFGQTSLNLSECTIFTLTIRTHRSEQPLQTLIRLVPKFD